MRQLIIGLAFVGLASCGDMRVVDPGTSPEQLSGLCNDPSWLKSILAGMSGNYNAEIRTNIYKGVRVFEIADCVEGCSDSMMVVYDCSGSVRCQFGGIAGMNTCPDYPFTSENRVLLWHN